MESQSWDIHYLLMLKSPGHGLRSQLGLLLLDVRAQRSPLDLSLGPGRHLYAVYVWYYGERKYIFISTNTIKNKVIENLFKLYAMY